MRAKNPIWLALVLVVSGLISGSSLASTNYQYDEAGRLTKVVASDGTTTTYQYDAAGNRIGRIVTIGGSGGFNQTIQVTGTGPVNLRSLAEAAGYSGGQDATITFEVGSGVTITGAAGAPDGGIAIDTGVWPTGYDVSLSLVVKNGGIIRGGGGRGASVGGPGGAGGDAVYCRLPMTITVESGGEVRAGGGGGGGSPTFADGWPEPQVYGGGSGGGGAPNGAGGSGGTGDPGLNGNDGAAGTPSGGGAGGWGGGNLTIGGSGGDYGASGTKGSDYHTTSGWAYGGSGGAAGFAIRTNGYTVNVTNNGTISGTVEGNQPPVAQDDAISVTAGVAYDFDPVTGSDSDPEGGALTITAKTDGAKGTVSILSGTQLRYTANAGTSGSDSFTYTVTDPEGASDTATVTVTISAPSNSAPVAQNDSASVTAGSYAIISVLSNDSDPDNDPLQITSLTQGSKGTAVLYNNNTQVLYSAYSSSSGTDSFTYTISDGNGGQATATVTVSISGGGGGGIGGCGENPCP